ncbi:MAG: endolytic transglycosylase MltG, partial [Clostridia bacterium]|nr:endolytic transglycosylase MltG [Clostridia bacterium]
RLTRPANTTEDGMVKVTIPEGWTVDQIARRLEEYCVCDYDAFYKTLQEYPFKHEYLKNLPTDVEGRINRLEGYLFPDTYYFYLYEGSVSAINKMLNNFNDRVIKNGSLGFTAHAADLGMSMDQIITLASIIERETPDKVEMRNVASVFYNRMRNKSYEGIGGKLQSDATKWYPFETPKAMLEAETYLGQKFTQQDKDNWVSNYDTTTFAGLPPGAICCPGMNSITAALNPSDTDYYYFFTDDNGKHYYASTYNKHLSNIEYCRSNGLYSG